MRSGSVGSSAALMGLILMAVGCGSDSDPAIADGGVEGNGGDLSGRILATAGAATRNTGVIYAIDPSSGRVDPFVEPKPEPGTDERYHNLSTFFVGGTLAEDALLLSVRNCDYSNPANPRTCVERVDADGAVERLYSVPVDIAYPAVMSPDGTLVATLVSPDVNQAPVTMLLASPTGAILARQQLSEGYDGIAGHDWTPDNRLVYAYRDPDRDVFTIIVSEPESLMRSGNRDRPPHREGGRPGPRPAYGPDSAADGTSAARSILLASKPHDSTSPILRFIPTGRRER